MRNAGRSMLNTNHPMGDAMWERVRKPKWLTPTALETVSILSLLFFVSSASRALAATTYHVKVGGETMGPPLAPGGMVWYNGYDPASIVIHPGDTITWDAVGGVHTVTSVALATNGSFLFDSSPTFTPADALADMGPGMLLAPGSVYDLDTTGLAFGTYTVFCKIHPGMQGNVTITPSASFSYTFGSAGTFVYFCKVHAYQIGQSWAGMVGIVHVVPLTSLDAVNTAVGGASAVGYGALGIAILALLVAVYGIVRGKGPRGSPPNP